MNNKELQHTVVHLRQKLKDAQTYIATLEAAARSNLELREQITRRNEISNQYIDPVSQSLLYTGKTPLENAAARGDEQAKAELEFRQRVKR